VATTWHEHSRNISQYTLNRCQTTLVVCTQSNLPSPIFRSNVSPFQVRPASQHRLAQTSLAPPSLPPPVPQLHPLSRSESPHPPNSPCSCSSTLLSIPFHFPLHGMPLCYEDCYRCLIGAVTIDQHKKQSSCNLNALNLQKVVLTSLGWWRRRSDMSLARGLAGDAAAVRPREEMLAGLTASSCRVPLSHAHTPGKSQGKYP
jgi:hypothetical protein